MKSYIIQVQLHDATARDYKLFSTEMKKAGFQPAKGNPVSGRAGFECHDRNSINEVINGILHTGAKTGKKMSFTVMKDKIPGKQAAKPDGRLHKHSTGSN